MYVLKTALSPVALALMGGLLAGALMSAPAAEARERQGGGSWQNSRGGSGTYQRHTAREPGSLNRETSWQHADGRSGASSLNRERNREAGSWSSDRSVTRGNGDTATWSKTGQKTDSGAVVHGEGTNFKGQDVSMDRAISKNDDGSRSVETTRLNETTGKSLSTDKTVTPTADGYVSTGSYTTGSGKTGTTSGSLVRTDSGTTRTNSLTTSEGQTAGRVMEVTHADGSATRTLTSTGFNGETHTHSTTVTPAPAP
ncbi:hypothetical protein [Thiobacillus sp.]|uniref:hypothetical protein n=1 Tax=Thiobacillus sp. TaxID=924 RepID=UPI00286E00B6|nr:hypothetical protein [Thiobacillus sp.]